MKKILFLMFAVLLCANTFAQVNIDKTNEDGTRIVSSHAENIYTNWTNAAAIRLNYYYIPEDDYGHFEISITFNEAKMTIDEGRKLLLKKKDGSIIELVNNTEIGVADYDYEVTKYGTNYYVRPDYMVTEAQIKEIIDGDIVKIRVETNLGYFDRDIKKNKLSKGLEKQYQAVLGAIAEEKTVYDGF